jgi:hypothetical protein
MRNEGVESEMAQQPRDRRPPGRNHDLRDAVIMLISRLCRCLGACARGSVLNVEIGQNNGMLKYGIYETISPFYANL